MTDKLNMNAKSIELYTDGSASPNPGFGGYGIYGIDNDKFEYNICGPIADRVTNNVAEMVAFIEAIRLLIKMTSLKEATLYCDSRYVIDGSNRIYKWKKNKWTNSYGMPVANRSLWELIDSLLEELKSNSIKFKVIWVKGHSNVYGNEKADRNANSGRILSINNNDEVLFNISLIKPTKDIKLSKIPILNPLLSGKRWFFNTNQDKVISDGRYIYMATTYKDKTEDKGKNLGKPASDTHYSILLTNDAIPELNSIRDLFNSKIKSEIAPVIINLTTVSKSTIWRKLHDSLCKLCELKGNLIVNEDDDVLGQVQRPPKLIFKLEKSFNFGLSLLDKYEKKHKSLLVSDITDLFIETGIKNKQSINKEFKQTTRIMVAKNIQLNKNIKTNVKLNIGSDIPIRNVVSSLLKVSKEPISIKLLIWETTKKSYRCASIIEQGTDICIYYSPDANFKLISKNKRGNS